MGALGRILASFVTEQMPAWTRMSRCFPPVKAVLGGFGELSGSPCSRVKWPQTVWQGLVVPRLQGHREALAPCLCKRAYRFLLQFTHHGAPAEGQGLLPTVWRRGSLGLALLLLREWMWVGVEIDAQRSVK